MSYNDLIFFVCLQVQIAPLSSVSQRNSLPAQMIQRLEEIKISRVRWNGSVKKNSLTNSIVRE